MSSYITQLWRAPTGLILLSLVPVAAGGARLVSLSTGNDFIADSERFLTTPLPVVLHILSVTIYCLLGAFQFSAHIRRTHRKRHRMTGRVLIPAGFIAALSGLWMTQFHALPAHDGALLYGLRMVFGFGMVLCLTLGTVAIIRRDFSAHQAWMMRVYAIGIGAGTQVFTHLPWMLIAGPPDTFIRAILMGAGWIINLAVVEMILWRTKIRA